MKTTELRQKFLKFFESKGHIIARSSSFAPRDDPTLLSTNVDTNQSKDVSLGFDKRPYSHVTTAQKCMRAGGKHNDLENVGYTVRHHTFFEVMGSSSFGDYFKRDAIHFAWEFLTSPEWLDIPKDKLLTTVYTEDDEAYSIWLDEVGMPAERIVRIGDNKGVKYTSDNFWQMGDTGPCGPCSEVFYDCGEEVWGGIPGNLEEDGDHWIEIWNRISMQFNHDEQGSMGPLPKPSVDTGMGLKHIAATMQHVHSNYEIDLFQDLLKAAAREAGVAFSMEEPSLKVIVDHTRSCSFLIADGVLPSNEGCDYVLRHIICCAVRRGYKLSQEQALFYRLVPDLVKEMGAAYPELKEKQTQIIGALRTGESHFGETLEKGMGLFNQALSDMKFPGLESLLPQDGVGKPLALRTADGVEFTAASRIAPSKKQIAIRPRVSGGLNEGMYIDLQTALETVHIPNAEKPLAEVLNTYLMDNIANSKLVISDEHILKLYDTYGFPYDLTADMVRGLDIELNEAGFKREVEAQRTRARATRSFKANAQLPYEGQDTEFKGYDKRQAGSRVLAFYRDGEQVDELNRGDKGAIIIDFTPFYVESGGRVGDVGYIFAGENRFEIRDTQKIGAAVFGQFGVQTLGRLKVDDSATTKVDDEVRDANIHNHSTTHLMHKTLRDVLSEHVEQRGSLVTAESTRLDISHPQATTAEEIAKVERRVNEAISVSVAVNAAITSMEDVQKTGAMMLFGEKYGDEVHILQMGDFFTELCGDIHVSRTDDIGFFKVINEDGIAAGVHRTEAITDLNALKWAQEQKRLVKDIIAETEARTERDVLTKIQTGAAHAKALEKELARAKAGLAVHAGAKLLDDARDLGAAKLVTAQIEADAVALREIVTDLTGKSEQAIVLLVVVNDGKVSLCVGVSKPLTGKVKTGDLVKFAAEQVGGKDGDRPDLAQAGSMDTDKLPEMLVSVGGRVSSRLV